MGWNHLGVLVLGLCCAAHVVWGQEYVNIAPGKSYNESSKNHNSQHSGNAADGNTATGSLFHSSWEYYPFWEVDLGRTYPVQNITVWRYYSGDTYLYPSNITVDGQLCVTVNSASTTDRNNSVACSSLLYGQRVRLTRNTSELTYLALREFEILVPRGNSRCDRGRWGPLCQYYCDNNCGGRAGTNFCYRSTVNCYDECFAGRWGDRCQNKCGQNCATGNCEPESGYCSACLPGWYGNQCDRNCSSQNCLLNMCDQGSGRCLACQPGYAGNTCTECVPGFSKQNTATCSPCSAFCNTGGCDMITGNCTNGCVDGRHGATCNTTCSPAGCQTCYQHSGQCTACRPLYNLDPTSQCKECKDGFSKHNSSICSPCSVSCKDRLCHGDTGDCVQGCRPGYHGQQCEESCSTIADQCVQCNQSGECTACSGHFQPPQCTGMKDESSQQSSVPVGSAILGAGLMLTVAVISVLVFLCWKHRSQKTLKDAETVAASSSDPVTASNNVYTASSSISPSASAQAGDVTPHVIRDPGNTYEQLRIYSNMVFDREAHSEPEPRGTDATTALSTSEHVHVSVEHVYANTSSATKERKPRKKKAN